MSRTELSRLQVMIDLAEGRTWIEDAAAPMGFAAVYGLSGSGRLRAHDPQALIANRRGKPSNRAHGAVFSRTCLSIVRERCEDFGPTLAAGKLAEVLACRLGSRRCASG